MIIKCIHLLIIALFLWVILLFSGLAHINWIIDGLGVTDQWNLHWQRWDCGFHSDGRPTGYPSRLSQKECDKIMKIVQVDHDISNVTIYKIQDEMDKKMDRDLVKEEVEIKSFMKDDDGMVIMKPKKGKAFLYIHEDYDETTNDISDHDGL